MIVELNKSAKVLAVTSDPGDEQDYTFLKGYNFISVVSESDTASALKTVV